jgi:carbamoyl-phosphate synthase large subunit
MRTVAVSGINAVDNPGPGTGVARCLKECDLDVRLIGLAYDTLEPGIYMDWLFDKSYILPYPSSNSSTILERLSYIHEREKIDVIIPVLDVELPLYMRMEKELESMGIKTMFPSAKAFRMRAKDNLFRLADKSGFRVPTTEVITDLSTVIDVCRKMGFPCFVKGPFYEAVKIGSPGEAMKAVHGLSAKWGLPVMIQENIPGDEYNCAGLADGRRALGMVAVKKVATTSLGKAWTIVSVNNRKIFDAAERMIQMLGWRGAFEIELILDRDTNEFYCIEINPRFPAWIFMSSACGINLPERMVKNLLGMEHETHSRYDAGKLMIRYTSELIRDIQDIENISIKAESW